MIQTNISRHMTPPVGVAFAILNPLVFKSVPEGAATQVREAVHPGAARISGEYLADCNVATPRQIATDAALAKRLWAKTEEIVAGL